MVENKMDLNNNNTLSGFHIRKITEGELKLYPKKYIWHIPKKLRHLNIQPGDIVQARAKDQKAPILVVNVYREEFEEIGKVYQRITKLIERAPKKETV